MLITLREAALLVGCSPRTLRARIQRGDLRGKKDGRAWWIESRSLPLNDEQRHRLEQRAEEARRAVAAALPREMRRPARSARDLEAFRAAAEARRSLLAAAGAAEAPCAELRAVALGDLQRGLLGLGTSVHEYDARLRARLLRRARRCFSRATAALLLEQEEPPASIRGTVELLEERVLPALGGLLRWAEQRARGGWQGSRSPRSNAARTYARTPPAAAAAPW